MRTCVYVDGFNLYYGCLKGTAFRWLDLTALCLRLLRPENKIVSIHYFTAMVAARPGDPGQTTRQQTYLRALRTNPQVQIHLGHFLSHDVTMPDAADWARGVYTARRVVKTEEKGSDVNLATQLLMDAFDDQFDVAVLISNDSDLATPVRLVKERFGKTVGLLNPHKTTSASLRPLASFLKQIRPWALAASQFPTLMADEKGAFRKPARW